MAPDMTDPTPLPDELQAILGNPLHRAAVRRGIEATGRTLSLNEFLDGIDAEPTEAELDAKYDPRNYLQGDSPIYLQDLGKPVPIHWTAREWVLWVILAAGVGIVAGVVLACG
jgi:hypothetical protein